METNRPEFRVRKSDIAKFEPETKEILNWGSVLRGDPKKVPEKALKQKIVNNRKDLLRKDLGSKKDKTQQTTNGRR